MKLLLGGGVLAAAIVVSASLAHSDAAAQIDPGAERPMPGEYRAQITFQSIDMPGAPPQMADMMSQMMSTTTSYCLTEAEIEEGYRAITNRSTQSDEDCTYERFSYSGGTIDAEMLCNVDGRTMRMEMTGTGGATSSDITMRMSGDFGMGDGSMTLRAQHERIGTC